MKKKNEELRFDPKVPVAKMSDWSRRAFIKRAGLFLSAFGVPWLTRIEMMSGLSKKLFGNSLAFAAGNIQYLVVRRGRAGDPGAMFGCQMDSTVTQINRNWHPGHNQVIQALASPGKTLYVAPQAAPLVGLDPANIANPNPTNPTSYAADIAVANYENTDGHTNMMQTSTMAGSSDYTAAFVAQQNALNPALTSTAFVFGSEAETSFSILGPLSGAHAPIYGTQVSQFTGIFGQYSMTPATGQPIDETLTTEIVGKIVEVDNGFLQVLNDQGRQGVTTVQSSLERMQQLLTSGLDQALTPTQAHIDAILGTTGGGNLAPNPQNKFNTVLGNTAQAYATFLAFAGLCFVHDATRCAGIGSNGGDWHGNTCQPGTNALNPADPNNGSIQGQHAAFFGQIYANALLAFRTNPLFLSQVTGEQIGDCLTIVDGESEFNRTCITNGGNDSTMGNDNGDGDSTKPTIISRPGGIKGGTYGNRNANRQYTRFNPDTGADETSTSLLDPSYFYGTITRILGLGEEHTGVTNPPYVKAIID